MPPSRSSAATMDCPVSRTPNLFYEYERQKTYSGWPHQHLLPNDLAKAGFYYLKRDDIVKCVFCGIEVGNWEEGDDPMNDHLRWSPGCRFANNQPVGNVPIAECSSGSTSEPGNDTTGCGNLLCYNQLRQEELGITAYRQPSFPQYSTSKARLRTFEYWPIALKLKPAMLADAGFFYTGKGDQTICFHCGGGLKDWEDNDDAWIEHGRWFPKCHFVLGYKGKEFVENLTSKPAEAAPAEPSNALEEPVAVSLKQGKEASQVEKDEDKHTAISDSNLCKICYAEELSVVFLPCGHMVACSKCALSHGSTCSVCRSPINATVRAYLT